MLETFVESIGQRYSELAFVGVENLQGIETVETRHDRLEHFLPDLLSNVAHLLVD